MPPDDPSDGTDALPSFTEKGDLKKFINERKDVQEVISDRDTLTQNAVRVAGKLQLALTVSRGMEDAAAKKMSDAIINKYIDELAATMNTRIQMEGEGVRDQFLALSEAAPKEIKDALAEAKKANPQWYEMHEEQCENILGHFAPPPNMKDGEFIEGEKEEKGGSYLSSHRWLGRPSIDGDLVKADWEIFRKIHAVPGTKEQAALDAMEKNMRQLYDMDKSNMTFINSTPALRPGARFAWSFLLAGAGLFSLLIAWKNKSVPKKGLLAIGLLLYLNRNRDSKLSFLSSPQYQSLTKELQGTEEGKKVLQALGESGNRTALKEFAKRERSRTTLPVTQRKELPASEESYAMLIAEMGFGKESAEAKRIRAMPFSDIFELSKTLHKFNPEELEIAEQFVRRGIDPVKAAAEVPIVEPAT